MGKLDFCRNFFPQSDAFSLFGPIGSFWVHFLVNLPLWDWETEVKASLFGSGWETEQKSIAFPGGLGNGTKRYHIYKQAWKIN